MYNLIILIATLLKDFIAFEENMAKGFVILFSCFKIEAKQKQLKLVLLCEEMSTVNITSLTYFVNQVYKISAEDEGNYHTNFTKLFPSYNSLEHRNFQQLLCLVVIS